jgi:transglutaminase-like putative cysteine protease
LLNILHGLSQGQSYLYSFGPKNAWSNSEKLFGTVMPILDIKHVTTYRYSRRVSFGKHRMMLLPRDDGNQKVIAYELQVRPEPIRIDWSRDAFDNHVATAQFDQRAEELSFVSKVRLDHVPANFRASDIDPSATRYPFTYSADDRTALNRYLRPPTSRRTLNRWSAQFLTNDNSTDLFNFLVDMTRTVKQTIKHESRHEEGIQDPVQTLSLTSGSCRDVAVLMIGALRSRGIAARFVSGYVHLIDDDEHDEDEENIAGGNTHAWVQVYVPGPGWVDFDPAAGVTENHTLIRVATVEDPHEAIPLQGTWYGSPSDHLAMNVAVRVRAERFSANTGR